MEPPTLPESVSLNNGLLSSTLGFLRSTFYRVLFIACHIISFPCVKPFKGFPVYSELKLLTITFKTPHEFPWLLLSLLISCHWVSCSSNSGPFAVPHIFSKLPLPRCSKCYSLCLEYSSLSFLPIISSPLFSSVQFSRSVVSGSLRLHESQHARHPCPSPAPGVYSNSCPSSRWCHPAISSSVVPFSSFPQSLPASGSFPMSQLFTWGGQSTGVSALALVLPMNTQDWSPLGWTGWISLQSERPSRVFSNTTVQKHQFFGTQLSSQSNSHIHTWPLEKP